jgi:putative transposase
MARKRREVKPLATIWRTPDPLWNAIEGVLAELDPPAHTGRERGDQRLALDGIIYQLRSGVQWNFLPKEFGSDSAVHRTFQRWIARGVFLRIWGLLIEYCDDLGAVDWQWQSADGALSKARFGGIKWAKTPRIAANQARNVA